MRVTKNELLTICLVAILLFGCMGSSVFVPQDPNESVTSLRGLPYTACATSTPWPTPTPVPTYTPYPTLTVVPTYTPYPLNTPPPTPPPAGGGKISGATVRSATINLPGFEAWKMLDGNSGSFWHTPDTPHPHTIEFRLGGTHMLQEVRYLPKQTDERGRWAGYTIETSTDGFNWNYATGGSHGSDSGWKTMSFSARDAAYVKIIINSAHDFGGGTGDWGSAAEVEFYAQGSAPPPVPTSTPRPTHTPLPTSTMRPTWTPYPTSTPIPSETPYYNTNPFYMNRMFYLSDDRIGIELVDYDVWTYSDYQDVRLRWRIRNDHEDGLYIPLSLFAHFSRVGGERGRWVANGGAYEDHVGDIEDLEAIESTLLDKGEERTYDLAYRLPLGTIQEVNVSIDVTRPDGGNSAYVALQTDPNPCPHGIADAPIPIPTPRGERLPSGSGFGGNEGSTSVNASGTPVFGGGGAVGPGISIRPVVGGSISRGFGCAEFPTGVDGTPFNCPPERPHFHNGIDYALPTGSEVFAPIEGNVEYAAADTWPIDCSGYAGSNPPHLSYGNYVKIRSFDGTQVHILAHLETFTVSEGDIVAQGQQVGTVNSTGCSTGAHLHQTCTINSVPTDPKDC